MNKGDLKNLIKDILLEVKKEKKGDKELSYSQKKDSEKSYLNGEKDKYREEIDNDASKTVESLVKKIQYAVSRIDKKITVELDDHNDISIHLNGVFKIRVIPKWSGIFDIEAYRNMSDRIYAVGLDNEQVLNFIKVNFAVSKKSYVQSAFDKSRENMEDNSKKKPKEIPTGNVVKEKEVKDKDKEESVTDKKDQPDSQLTPVDEKKIEKQSDHEVEKNKEMPKIQRMIKKENS